MWWNLQPKLSNDQAVHSTKQEQFCVLHWIKTEPNENLIFRLHRDLNKTKSSSNSICSHSLITLRWITTPTYSRLFGVNSIVFIMPNVLLVYSKHSFIWYRYSKNCRIRNFLHLRDFKHSPYFFLINIDSTIRCSWMVQQYQPAKPMDATGNLPNFWYHRSFFC